MSTPVFECDNCNTTHSFGEVEKDYMGRATCPECGMEMER